MKLEDSARSVEERLAAPNRSLRLPRLFIQAAAVLALAVLLYAAMALWSGLDRLGDGLERLQPGLWVEIAVLVGGGWLLRGLRWHLYTRHLGLAIPLPVNLLVFGASFAFTATPGKAGEVVKSLMLRITHGVAVTVTAGALLAERLVDLLAVLLFAAAGLTMVDARIYFAASALLLAAMVLVVVHQGLQRAVLGFLRRVPAVGRAADPLGRLLEAGRRLLEPRPLAAGLALALVAWGCEALSLHLILRALGAPVPLASAAALFGLATLVGALSMLPGGLGGFEATLLLLLASLGVERGLAVAATLLLRLSTLWFISFAGALLLALWWLGNRHRVAMESSASPPWASDRRSR